MKYLLEWHYLGTYSETFNSNDIYGSLYDHIKEYFDKNKPFEGIVGEVIDEGGNIVFILE